MWKLPSRRLSTVAEAVAFFKEVEQSVALALYDAALQLAASKGASVYADFDVDFKLHLTALIALISEMRLRSDHLEHLEGQMEMSPSRPGAGTNSGGAVRDARKRALRDFSPLAQLLQELTAAGEINAGAVSALISYLKKPTPYR